MSKDFTAGRISLLGRILAYIVMSIFTLLTILPLIWLGYSSFKSNPEFIKSPMALPRIWFDWFAGLWSSSPVGSNQPVDFAPFAVTSLWSNYANAWKIGSLGISFFNTVLYTTVGTALTTFLSISTGFAFSKFKFRVTNFFNWFIMAGLLISVQAVLVPLYIIWNGIGLYDTRMGVILPYVAFSLPLGIYLATAFIKGIPDALVEAAIIDGASYLAIFRRIILPLSRPVVITIVILTFLANWNEFVFAFMLTGSTDLRSLSVNINAFAGTRNHNYGLQFAALVIGILPTIVFYIFFHRQLMVGFAEGALKD